MNEKSKIFVFINGGKGTDMVTGAALSEDGHFLAGHLSSSEGWFRHDMGLTSNWKHKEYEKHYPNGYELIEVSDHHPGLHEGLDQAYQKHLDLAQRQQREAGRSGSPDTLLPAKEEA